MRFDARLQVCAEEEIAKSAQARNRSFRAVRRQGGPADRRNSPSLQELFIEAFFGPLFYFTASVKATTIWVVSGGFLMS